MEIWKTIKDFEDYQVSNLGNVKITANEATRKERVLKPLITGRGYYRVALYKNTKPYFKSIHRLVAEYFIPNPDNKKQVNHLDGNKENNRVDNLEWCTYRENVNHAIENKLSACGERNGNSKLTQIQVNEIRNSGLSSKELALYFNVHVSTINRIKRKEGWK